MAATYKKLLRSPVDVNNRTDSALFVRNNKYLEGIEGSHGALVKTKKSNPVAAIKIDMDKIRGEQWPNVVVVVVSNMNKWSGLERYLEDACLADRID